MRHQLSHIDLSVLNLRLIRNNMLTWPITTWHKEHCNYIAIRYSPLSRPRNKRARPSLRTLSLYSWYQVCSTAQIMRTWILITHITALSRRTSAMIRAIAARFARSIGHATLLGNSCYTSKLACLLLFEPWLWYRSGLFYRFGSPLGSIVPVKEHWDTISRVNVAAMIL